MTDSNDLGVRFKFRTEQDANGIEWATATIWMDEPIAEIARVRLDFFEGSGDPNYHAWVDALSSGLNASLERLLGVTGVTSKRKKPSYTGEGR